MKTLPPWVVIAALAAACATQEPQQVARADCKVAPVTTKSAVNKPGPMTELDRKWAEAQLRSTEYRRMELMHRGESGAIESALQDCN